MLDSLINILSSGATGHSPQTAMAAVLCAALVNFLS